VWGVDSMGVHEVLTWDERNQIVWLEHGIGTSGVAYDVSDEYGPLFAAAPDLLAALEDVTAELKFRFGYSNSYTQKADEAIAKAKGENL